MRSRKSLLWILLMATPVILFANVNTVFSIDTRVYVDPLTSYSVQGESFTVDIMVAEVVNLHTWQVNMSYSPDVLEFVNVTEGDFLEGQPEGTWTTPPKVNDTEGWVLFAWYTQGEYPGVSGDGCLATVEFQTLSKGESILDINHTTTRLIEMKSVAGGYIPTEIPCTKESGYFTSLITPSVAEFTHSPEKPGKNDVVTFNASMSSPGWNGTQVSPIVSYAWDFGDNTTAIYVGANLTAITTHTYTMSGMKDVTLNVTDSMGLSSTKTAEVWVKFTHDIAIPLGGVVASRTAVVAGENVTIDVTVMNLGEETESFDLIAYYGETQIDTKPVTNLAPDAITTVSFSWDTTEVDPGTYAISAKADVVGEERAEDNVRGGGSVTVESAGVAFPMEMVIAIVVVIVIVVGVGAFLLMRRRGSPPA